MTDGPYNQSIRGEEPGGLRWLFLQIAALLGGLAALPDLLAAVQQIRDDLRRIAGAPEASPAWEGLPLYLNTVLGRYPSPEGTSELDEPYLSAPALAILRQLRSSLAGDLEGVVPNRLGAIQTALASVQGRTVSLDNTLFIIRESVGVRNSSNNHAAALDYLRAIESFSQRSAECCEEQNSTPDPNPDNNAPINFGCPNAVRVSRWTNVGVDNSTTPAQNIWQPHWDNPPPGIALNTFQSGARTSYNLFTGVSKYDLCLSWNFNNNEAQPTNIGVDIAPDPQVVATSNAFGGGLTGSSSFVIGGWIIELSSCVPNDPGNDAVKWLFRFPQGVTPGLNAFLASVQRNCAQ